MLESLPIEHIQKVTTAAAESVIDLHGSMDKNAIDGAAVNAMRAALNQIEMTGTVVIGEGQKDNAPMLSIGEKVGTGTGIAVDIAVDPIDGTSLVAKGKLGAVLHRSRTGFFGVEFEHVSPKFCHGKMDRAPFPSGIDDCHRIRHSKRHAWYYHCRYPFGKLGDVHSICHLQLAHVWNSCIGNPLGK
jgi:hypothetical protein